MKSARDDKKVVFYTTRKLSKKKEERNHECTENLPVKRISVKKNQVRTIAESTVEGSVREYVEVTKIEYAKEKTSK